MDLEQTYKNIISDLQQGKRGLIKLEDSLIQALIDRWEKGLTREKLHQTLCILDHSTNYSLDFTEYLVSELKNEPDSESLIFLLGAAQKHIITAAAMDGFPPNSDFMMTLKELLNSKATDNPEVLEWFLRTIEQTGMKSILFKEAVLKKKPGLGAMFNQHKKACKEIIELLERRWAPIKGGPLG